MNKIIILTISFILSLNSFLLAQDLKIIKGQISSLSDTISIPYAHIGILGTGIGTVSNINGNFELKGEFNTEKDTLMISHVEYEKKLIPLNELVADTNYIKLARNEYLLADVIVLPDDKKEEIFKKAIKNLKINYPDKLYQCEAFYREIQYEQKTKKHCRLIEAAINIQDGKATSPLSKIKCSLLQFRKSNNFTEEHWGSKLLKKILGYHTNYLQHLLIGNPIRYYKDRLHTSNFNALAREYNNKKIKFEVSQIIKKHNNDVYVLIHQSPYDFVCKFYINKNDHAIIQYEKEMRSKIGLVYKIVYQFKKINNKYYPAFFYNASVTDYLKNSKGLGITESSLTFVNYSPERKKFKRLRSKHVLPNEVDLYDQEMEYDENFWANYNILLDEPLEDKVITDLERETSLQNQFKENATN